MGEDEKAQHGGEHRSHKGHGGTPLDEATPERREQWKKELEAQGKYTPGASLNELIAKRDGEKTGTESE
jgi:hypothetical protein